MQKILLLIALVAMLFATGCSSRPPSNQNNLCSIFDQKRSWYRDAKKANKKWGTPIHVMMAIMKQESGYRHDAKPPKKKILWVIPAGRVSSAYGYSQALDGTWDTYKRDTGRRFARRSDFGDAIDFIGWYTNTSQRKLGISKWDAYNQYLAYHQGHGGYARGSHNSKGWLKSVARRVDQNARRYGAQLKECRG